MNLGGGIAMEMSHVFAVLAAVGDKRRLETDLVDQGDEERRDLDVPGVPSGFNIVMDLSEAEKDEKVKQRLHFNSRMRSDASTEDAV